LRFGTLGIELLVNSRFAIEGIGQFGIETLANWGTVWDDGRMADCNYQLVDRGRAVQAQITEH